MINLMNSDISDADCCSILKGIFSNTSLLLIDITLRDNGLSPACLKNVASAIANNSIATECKLFTFNNNCGAREIFLGLAKNTKISKVMLGLKDSGLTNECGMALAVLLRDNATITELFLSIGSKDRALWR